MRLALPVWLAVCVAAVPGLAQVSVTQATAGIDPNTVNPTFSPGLNGLSTGQTVTFTALGTGPSPSISRQTLTLTGEALSQYQASILSGYSQAMGSNFAYTTTTGNQIPGVANTLNGGYNEQGERPQSESPSTVPAGGAGDAALANVLHAEAVMSAMMVAGAAVLGAAVVL